MASDCWFNLNLHLLSDSHNCKNLTPSKTVPLTGRNYNFRDSSGGRGGLVSEANYNSQNSASQGDGAGLGLGS